MSLKDSLQKINEECAEQIAELQRKKLSSILANSYEESENIDRQIENIAKIIRGNTNLIKELEPSTSITTIQGGSIDGINIWDNAIPLLDQVKTVSNTESDTAVMTNSHTSNYDLKNTIIKG